MKVAIVDNFDSFTHNLIHYIEMITGELPTIYRNDMEDISILDTYDCLVLSPGPGLPKESGKLLEIIGRYYHSKPILGVCLGHQALGYFFGADLKNLKQVYHGESAPIKIIHDSKLYKGLPKNLDVGRYHSWVVDAATLSQDLVVTAIDEHDDIMSFEHKTLPIIGIQYHPESILSPNGKAILTNYFEGLKTLQKR